MYKREITGTDPQGNSYHYESMREAALMLGVATQQVYASVKYGYRVHGWHFYDETCTPATWRIRGNKISKITGKEKGSVYDAKIKAQLKAIDDFDPHLKRFLNLVKDWYTSQTRWHCDSEMIVDMVTYLKHQYKMQEMDNGKPK